MITGSLATVSHKLCELGVTNVELAFANRLATVSYVNCEGKVFVSYVRF